jgi:formylglycine-generating enzyme required for sulfatase activity/WD40 repeat protein
MDPPSQDPQPADPLTSYDVFISHSSHDKTISDAVCATLEGKGIRCWVAPRDILAGANWGESIIDAISDTRVMVLILSSNSNISKQVMREVERAVHKGTVIIPLRVEDIPLSKSLEYFLSTAHWLDAFTPPLNKHLEELASRIEQLISDAPVPERELTPAPTPRSSKRRWVIGAGALATFLIVAGYFLLGDWQTSTSPVDDAPGVAENKAKVAAGKAAAEKAAMEKAAAESAEDSTKKHKVRASRGFRLQTLPEVVARQLGAVDGGLGVYGILPEQDCGIEPGDVLIKFGGQHIRTTKDFVDKGFLELEFGKIYKVTVLRGGKPFDFDLHPVPASLKKDQKQFELPIFGENRQINLGDVHWLTLLHAANNQVVVFEGDGILTLWNTAEITPKKLESPDTACDAAALSNDGLRAVFAPKGSGELLVWNTQAGRVSFVLEGHPDREIVDVVVSSDGSKCISIDDKGVLKAWDLEKQKLLYEFDLTSIGLKYDLFWLSTPDKNQLSRGGRYLLMHTATKIVLWDLEKRIPIRIIKPDKSITAAALSLTAESVAIGLKGGNIEIWNLRDRKKEFSLRGHTGRLSDLKLIGQNVLISASGDLGGDNSVRLWDLREHKQVWQYNLSVSNGIYSFGPRKIAFDEDSHRLWFGAIRIREFELPDFIPLNQEKTPISDPDFPPLARTSQPVIQSLSSSAFVGVGIQISATKDGILINKIVSGGAAAKERKLQVGDLIVAAAEADDTEFTPFSGSSFADAQRLLIGKRGTQVRFKVRRDGKKDLLEITATRDKIVHVATKNKPAASDYSNSLEMTFRLIPGGAFLMGADGFLTPEKNALPRHRVRISQPFYMATYEVTQEAFETVMKRNPSAFAEGGRQSGKVQIEVQDGDLKSMLTDYHPVDSVTWIDAVEFCKRLSEREGRTYRLPTEAEWEFACRAGATTTWYWGNDRSDYSRFAVFTANRTTQPVGSKTPNDLGLYDMLGNVAEWCHDSFEKEYYHSSASVNPTGPSEKAQFKVVRGEGFNEFGRSWKRQYALPDQRAEHTGFRVLLDLTDEELDKYQKQRDKDHPELKLPPLEKLVAPPGHLEKAAVLIEQARTACTDGKHEVARKALIEALRRNPGYYLAHVGKWPVRNNLTGEVQVTEISGLLARQLVSSENEYSQLRNWSRYYNQGNSAYKEKNYHGGIVAYLSAHEAVPTNIAPGWALNNLAYNLAICPENQIRDMEAAIEFAKQACALTDWHYWAYLGTLAECYSAAGEFENATRVAEAILKNLPEKTIEGSGEPSASREEWEFNLKRFKDGMP